MSIWNKPKDEDATDQGRRESSLRPVASPGQPAPATSRLNEPRPMPEPPRATASIGTNVIIKGEIHCGEDLYIDGKIEGRLEMGQHRLTIGRNGQVRASIRAREVDVHGAVNGNVDAAERIIIRKDAKLVGDLKMAGVVIEDGAYFKGSIDITQGRDEKAAGPPVIEKSAGVTSAG
jgi:cytoskeletal protein CcmA (bactofilin family)